MVSDEFPKTFDPSRCVLFLGAGFSADADNKAGGHPPVGKGLEKEIKKLSGIPADDPVDFSDAAGYAISQGFEIYDLLERLFTVKNITQDQISVLTLPWWRIYTTNYDNSVTLHRSKFGGKSTDNIFDITDEAPRQLRQGAVIHLHGSIAKCDPKNLNDSLVLSKRSYVEQRVRKSSWWEWFDRDVRISQYVFFLGYDLNDFEPASYLIKYPNIRDRCHFILRKTGSVVASSKLSDYGVRHSFELSGFVERLDRARTSPAPENENALSGFRYIDLSKDDKLLLKPTSAEIQELFAFGRIRFDAMKATIPESNYAVFRSRIVDSCVSALADSKTIAVHSKIGNGKSILCNELKIVLSQEGRKCFELRDNITPPTQDIEFLKSLNSVVIFFPTYDSAVANMPLFSEMPEDTRYVVELASSTLQVRFQEVLAKLHGNVARIQIDKLDRGDINALRTLLEKAGLSRLAASPSLHEGIEFRDFLLKSYEEPEIAKRLEAVISPLVSNPSARRIISATAIFKVNGLPVDVGFIEGAISEDAYASISGLGDNIFEIMNYNIDKLEPHSSILSEHILRKFIDPKDYLDTIFDIASEAARRVAEATNLSTERFRKARAILSSILRFSFIESIVGKGDERRKLIGRLYEKCRENENIKKHPLFWLQYSIYWQDAPRWDLAESHMVEAYARGDMLPNFRTYQLDTNYLGLLCELELNSEPNRSIGRFDRLCEMIGICRSMIDDGNHRNHVIKAFSRLEPMVRKRKNDFTLAQATTLTYELNLVAQRLNGLSPSERAIWGTDSCKDSIENCISLLVSAGV